uniref:WD_REPEATS_REGION domain-containing protein n=1 Tax=Loa loa TaxID=7209 RepID=A0A1I7VAG5_LOALO
MSRIDEYSSHELGSEGISSGTGFSAWVVCQFAKDRSAEHLLAIGDENGFIHFLDVREEAITNSISADRSCVIDVSFVANRPNNLISISGHAKVTSWDIERQIALQQFLGHEGSVRALSVPDENPDLFATGARDGTICIWDRREPQATVVRPFNLLENTHPLLAPEQGAEANKYEQLLNAEWEYSAHSSSQLVLHLEEDYFHIIIPSFNIMRDKFSQNIGTKRRSRMSVSTSSKGITSLVHYNGNTLISASSSFKTGIRFWDLRYRGKNGPFRILDDPNSILVRDFGIASICLDRFSSSLFVASTDSKIYQYSVQGLNNAPVGILQGVKRTSFNTYDFRIAASPTSDHVMFGGGDCFAVIWDLQEKYSNSNTSKLKYLPYPKYTLGGHRYEVTVARFSSNGRYIVTMDDSYLKIWNWSARNSKNQSPITMHQDCVELYELPETARAEMSMKQLNVSVSIPKKNTERSPFKSPFKSPLNRVDVETKNGSESPVKKMFKVTESISPPLCDLTNKSSHAARKLDFSGIETKSRVPCAFYFKYPTMNLPDFVKEKLAASNVNSESQTTILEEGRSPELDEHSSSSDRPSNCSNMISMKERVDRTSPRKIRVKQSLHKPRERIHRQSTPKMPVKSRTDLQNLRQNLRSQNPSTDIHQLTPKSRKKSGTQRTLDQYFIRTPRTY